MIVNNQKNIVFYNPLGVIVDYELLKKAIIWKQEKPTASKKKIYLHGKYPAVSIHNQKHHIHRLIYSFYSGKELKPHEHVHHINSNKMDARIDNLTLMTSSEHLSMENKGKILSDNHKNLISLANKRRIGIKMKKHRSDVDYRSVWNLHKTGYSINYIAKYLATDWTTIKNRLNDIYENLELLEE